MQTGAASDQKVWGALILERLGAIPVPAALKPFVAAFRKEHDALEAASVAADAARELRDDALDLVRVSDDALDRSVEALANALVSAGLGDRKHPFGKFARLAPSEVMALAYGKEVKEVRALVKKVKAKKPPADVGKAVVTCAKAADAVDGALRKLGAPQAKLAKALASRDAQLLGWTKSLSKLMRQASEVWDAHDPAARAIFAHPDRVQRSAPRPAKANGAAAVAAPARAGA